MPEQRAILLLLLIVVFVWAISRNWQNPALHRLGFHQHLLSHDPISFSIASLCLNSTGVFNLNFFSVLFHHIKIISPPLFKGLLLKKNQFNRSEFSDVFVIIVLIMPVHGLHERKSARWCHEQKDVLNLRFCHLLPVFPARQLIKYSCNNKI